MNKGKLLTWTKGFAAKNAIGHDVVKLLQDALDRKHVSVRCSALVNDTVGTLLSRSYQSGPALIGAIFGTGTNGAYIDRVETISKLGEAAIAESKKGGKDAGEYMVVNTEWGAIDNQVSWSSDEIRCLVLKRLEPGSARFSPSLCSTTSSTESPSTRECKTDQFRNLDLANLASSFISRKQAFEKMVSGMCKFRLRFKAYPD